jgi:hypothetical protein
MRKLILKIQSKEWQWGRLVLEYETDGPSWIRFCFSYKHIDDSAAGYTIYYGTILVDRYLRDDEYGPDKCKVVICSLSHKVVKVNYIHIDSLLSAESFIKSLYLSMHGIVNKLV